MNSGGGWGWGDRLKVEISAWLGSAKARPPLSADFVELVRSIGEARSKQEEDRIIKQEAQVLRAVLSQPESTKNMREYVIRLLYCEMLGHEVPFGYIHAVNMTQGTNLLDKRVGYLAASSFLHKDHEFIILLISSFRRDLVSSNHLGVCAALTTMTQLISVETIPAVLPLVVDLLRHPKAAVRKKAIMVLQRFHALSPESIISLRDQVRACLCDPDPSVMAATLCLLQDLITRDANSWKDLAPSIANIAGQVIDRCLPRHYDYHSVPAPWVQIRLIQLLGVLGADDKRASECMYPVLSKVMKRSSNIRTSAAFAAVAYSCLKAIFKIYPQPSLLAEAAEAISQFVSSTNNNLKYLGIDTLAEVILFDPKIAQRHQLQVINCLHDPDDTLKKKTLDLLYRMTNPMNVEIITEKLLDYLKNFAPTATHLKAELASRITYLAEKYAPSSEWFLDTMTKVFILGGDLVGTDVAHNLMQLVAEGAAESDSGEGGLEREDELQVYAVETFTRVLCEDEERLSKLPSLMIQLLSWILSEYGQLSRNLSLQQIMLRLCQLSELLPQQEHMTRNWIVTALMKLIARTKLYPELVEHLVSRCCRSSSVDLQQRCFELEALVTSFPEAMPVVLPVDASCVEVVVDERLPFLDDYVQRALLRGAKCYLQPSERTTSAEISSSHPRDTTQSKAKPELKWQTYVRPTVPGEQTLLPVVEVSRLNSSPAPVMPVKAIDKKWTKDGYKPSMRNAVDRIGALEPESTPLTEYQPNMQDTDTDTSSDSIASSSGYGNSAFEQPTITSHNSPQQALANNLFRGVSVAAGPLQEKGLRNTRRKAKEERSTRQDVQSRWSNESQSSTQAFQTSPLLLDLHFASQPTNTESLPSANLSVDDLLSDIRPLAGSSSSAMNESENVAMLSSLKFDFAAQATTPLPAVVLSYPHNGNFDFSRFDFPPTLKRVLFPIPAPSDLHLEPAKLLHQDQNIHLSYTLVCAQDDHTSVVLFLSNKTSYGLSDLSAMFHTPANLKVQCVATDGIEHATQAHICTFSCPRLPLQSFVVIILSFKLNEFSFHMPIEGKIAYQTHRNQKKRLNFSLPLQLMMFLRPFPMTTADYSQKWSSALHEKKIRVSGQARQAHTDDSITSITHLVTWLTTKMNCSHIQTIGAETIAAATIYCSATTTEQICCLVHGKYLSNNAFVLTIRSENKVFVEMLSRYCERVWQ
ncbi:AP-4 complex subunit epsilon [Balamuthia mandrillaris]